MAGTGVPYFPQTLPTNTIVGRISANAGPTEAIPLATLAALISPTIVANNNLLNNTSISAGSGTVQTLATNVVAYTLTVGVRVGFTCGVTNTGDCSMNISGTGAIAIRKRAGTAGLVPLVANDMIANLFYTLSYDGTVYEIFDENNPVLSIPANLQAAPYTILYADQANIIDATAGGTFTLGAGTAVNGWWCGFRNNTTSGISLTSSSGDVDGQSVVGVQPGNSFIIQYSGGHYRTIGLRRSFVSSQQAVTAGGQLILAHTLGIEPSYIALELQCVTNDIGFTAGQHTPIGVGPTPTANRGVNVLKDASNITIRFGADANVFDVIRPDTGAMSALGTPASWKLVIKASL